MPPRWRSGSVSTRWPAVTRPRPSWSSKTAGLACRSRRIRGRSWIGWRRLHRERLETFNVYAPPTTELESQQLAKAGHDGLGPDRKFGGQFHVVAAAAPRDHRADAEFRVPDLHAAIDLHGVVALVLDVAGPAGIVGPAERR